MQVDAGASPAELRRAYMDQGLREDELDPNPFKQFEKWFKDAQAAKVIEPNAMALATATRDGKPAARYVLLRGLDERGFVFFTNYESSKGHELADNPRAALVFFWAEVSRQVRVEGRVEKVPAEESDKYFATRPRDSQLSAWASHQDEVIPNRAALEQKMRECSERFPNAVPRPNYWGGYRVIPAWIEFWQGRPGRLHDRLRYTRQGDGSWKIERLAP